MAFMLISYSHSFFHKRTNLIVELVQASDFAMHSALRQELGPDTELQLSLPDHEGISVRLTKEYWGVFELMRAEAMHGKNSFTKIALVGKQFEDSFPALYLRDKSRPLVLAGSARISGDAFLPAQGIRMGNISGHSYYHDQLLYGRQKQSSSRLNELEQGVISQIKRFSDPTFEPQGETVIFRSGLELKNSFQHPTKILKGSTVYLGDVQLMGNIVVWATERIIVSNTTLLKDIILIAPEIEFQEGVKANLQAFASRKITIGKNCDLAYPTTLAVYRKEALENQQSVQIPTSITLASGTI